MSKTIKTITAFRILFGIGLLILFVFSYLGNNKHIDSELVQKRINEVIPFSFEKGGGDIIINKAKLIPGENERLAFNTEFYYDDEFDFVRSAKKYFGVDSNKTQDTMVFIFSFDISVEDGILYFKNISNVKVFWKKDKTEVKVFKNSRFLNSFVHLMEDIKLYRIGDRTLLKNKALLYFLDIDSLSVDNVKNGHFDIVVHYGLKSIFVFILFIFILLVFSREIFLFLILIYQKFLSNRKNYICARGVHLGETCSTVVYNEIKNKGFISGVVRYFNSSKECKESYRELKRIKKGKRMNSSIQVTNFSNCSKSLFKRNL